nr:hypothetical protein Iba_chr12eCG7540 [Ipomoea batatas]
MSEKQLPPFFLPFAQLPSSFVNNNSRQICEVRIQQHQKWLTPPTPDFLSSLVISVAGQIHWRLDEGSVAAGRVRGWCLKLVDEVVFEATCPAHINNVLL